MIAVLIRNGYFEQVLLLKSCHGNYLYKIFLINLCFSIQWFLSLSWYFITRIFYLYYIFSFTNCWLSGLTCRHVSPNLRIRFLTAESVDFQNEIIVGTNVISYMACKRSLSALENLGTIKTLYLLTNTNISGSFVIFSV